MNVSDPTSWFLIVLSFSVLTIAVFLIRTYANKYADLKANVHAIHLCIEKIDSSLEDDSVSKEEFVAIVKRVLAILAGIK
jgi:hypothetical protein